MQYLFLFADTFLENQISTIEITRPGGFQCSYLLLAYAKPVSAISIFTWAAKLSFDTVLQMSQ